MGRTGRTSGRTRSVGLAVAAVGVIAVAAGILWPTLQGRGAAYAQGGGVIPIPSADADAAGTYWASRLSPTGPGLATAPLGSGSAGAGVMASPGLPSPSGSAGTLDEALVSGSPMSVSNPLAGSPFTGVPQIGALFGTSNGSIDGQGHYCTGSVVNSPRGDVIVTAAHCVYDSSGVYTDIAFVPGYHDGQDPYGVWIPSAVVVSPQWASGSDPDYDVAFVIVHEQGSAAKIQDVVGGDQLGLSPGYTGLTQVVGYPENTEQPIACTNATRRFTDPSLSVTQLEFDCADYPGGTSGGPFLQDVDANTGLGSVVGVIGGYEAGGDTPDVSYSSYFGEWVGSLFAQAETEG
jgi:V8-like Glu-specific endopeptidase